MKHYIFSFLILGLALSSQCQVMRYTPGASTELSSTIGCSGNSVNVDGGTLYIDCANNLLGGSNTSPQYPLDVTGALRASGQGIFGGTVTVNGAAFSVGVSTLSCSNGLCGIATATPRSTLEVLGSFQAGTGVSISTITSGGQIQIPNNTQIKSVDTKGNLINLIYKDNGDGIGIGNTSVEGVYISSGAAIAPTGFALCLNSSRILKKCTSVVGADGSCTCP